MITRYFIFIRSGGVRNDSGIKQQTDSIYIQNEKILTPPSTIDIISFCTS